MGEIFAARHQAPGGFVRRVVVKRLRPSLAQDVAVRRLFEREAFLLARLGHPNVVRAIDYYYEDGTPHLVLEHVAGKNLRRVAQGAKKTYGALPVRFALHAVAQLCRGLHYLHHATDEDGQGLRIIHRDICPSNVMVSYFGEVKLIDLGIANMAGAARLTQPGFFRGKVQYAAPEQMTGAGDSVLSDVYSAGVVLAELLSGRLLFDRKSVKDTLHQVVTEDRENTISRVLARVKPVPGFRAALRGALAIQPQDRFESALQFAETLETIARKNDLIVGPEELGLYVRRVFELSKDVPVDGHFDDNAGANVTFSFEQRPELAPEIATDVIEEAPLERPAAKGVLRWLHSAVM